MPPQVLFDLSVIDLTRDLYDQEAIRRVNLQRGDMEHLNGVVHLDGVAGRAVGYKDVTADEFWVPWHIPGRPILPGVLMIEAAAQLASFYTRTCLDFHGFVGFGGVDDVKFRQQVPPGKRLYVLLERVSVRHGHCKCRVQGLVDGGLVFEGIVTGIEM
jgi:3-hydroxyacyl-[acyl-carrier-protein] dehydratase